MKRISFKAITTVWITLLIAAVCSLSIASLIIMSSKTAEEKLMQAVISAVENNIDEIEYSNGIFEIENDFDYYSGGVYCDIFSESNKYIGGETPHALITGSGTKDGTVTEEIINGEKYYVYSALLSFTKFEYEIDIKSGQIISYEADVTPSKPLESIPYSQTSFENGISTAQAVEIALEHAGTAADEAEIISVELPAYRDRQVFKIEFTAPTSDYGKIRIRGICPASSAAGAFETIGKTALYLIPAFIIIAALGAYIISRQTIKPVKKITESAQEITSGSDLSKRLDASGASDEIHTLAQTFNGMFERLQASFENEKQFTSDASHELRTPLAVIKAECDFALSNKADDSDRIEALESIQEQTDKMAALVSALLAVTRAEQGSNRFKLEKGNLSELAEDICKDFKTTKGIRLNHNIEKDIIINMDEALICRMLENLLSNADKYGKENGIINVKLYTINNEVILTVKDNGIGINADDLPKIWGRFYRADASRTEREGFGLGLALVKKIAEIHSAECKVESEPGKGSEFTVILKKI